MKIKFFNPNDFDRNVKATIHKSGKLGFTVEAAKKLGLSNERSMFIGINEEDVMDQNLYVVVNPDKREGAFNIAKAGAYFYVNTKALFDSLKYDYVNSTIMFDIVEEMSDTQRVFKFKKRVVREQQTM